MVAPVMFSSKSVDWSSPQGVFDELHAEFHFVLDVCATQLNNKCSAYYTRYEDGLAQEWADAVAGRGAVWMNPPYGREIGTWVAKAAHEANKGATVVCLLPARTDTKWWHRYVIPHAEVRFVKGRLKFGGAKNAAPFPSAIVIFRGAH